MQHILELRHEKYLSNKRFKQAIELEVRGLLAHALLNIGPWEFFGKSAKEEEVREPLFC